MLFQNTEAVELPPVITHPGGGSLRHVQPGILHLWHWMQGRWATGHGGLKLGGINLDSFFVAMDNLWIYDLYGYYVDDLWIIYGMFTIYPE